MDLFWQKDLGTFAQAVGFDDASPAGRPFRTIAPSPGQLLDTGILDEHLDKLLSVADRLFQPDMLAGAGIQTKSTTAARYSPGGYYNGSVWPTISLEIAVGLHRSSNRCFRQAQQALTVGKVELAHDLKAASQILKARAIDLEDRAIAACAEFPTFPEFFRGGEDIAVNTEVVLEVDRDGTLNTKEQPPQPQGWTATAIYRILHARGEIGTAATASA